MTNQKAIYSYLDIYFNGDGSFVKFIGTHGHPGSGKSFNGKYYAFYLISKCLIVTSTSAMAQRSVNLGGSHICQLFYLEISSFSNPRHTS